MSVTEPVPGGGVLEQVFDRVRANQRTVAHVIVGLAVAATVVGGLLFWRYTVDDSFITFRYAQNLARGAGAVFNRGERVEGISNFAWMLILALIARIGGPVEMMSKVLGLAATVGMVLVLYRSLVRRRCRPVLAAVASLWLVTIPTLHMYATSGLETLPYSLAVLAATVIVSGGLNNGTNATVLAICLTVIPALRPEGIGCSLVLAAWLLITQRGRLTYLVVGATGTCLLIGLLARYGYYGELLPNTFRAKTSPIMNAIHEGPSAFLTALVGQATLKVTPFFYGVGGPLLAALMGAGLASGDRRLVAPGVLVFSMGVAFTLYAPIDWMPGFRFGVPYVAPALFAATLGCDRLLDGLGNRAWRMMVCAGALAIVPFLGLQAASVAHEVRAYARGAVHKAMLGHGHVRMGEWMAKNSKPDDVVAAYEIGALGYFGDRRIIDYEGLISPYIGRLRAATPDLHHGRDSVATRRLAQFVASQGPRWFFANPSLSLDANTPLGTAIEQKDLLFPDQWMILEEIEKCYGAKLRLAQVFSMSDDPHDFYVLLGAPDDARCAPTARATDL